MPNFMLIGSGVSGRQDPQKCHFLYLSERPLQQSCTTVQTVMMDICLLSLWVYAANMLLTPVGHVISLI